MNRPTSKEFIDFGESEKVRIIQEYSTIEGFAKEELIGRIYDIAYHSALSFLLEHKKANDKSFAESVHIPKETIQDMIDKSIEKHKPVLVRAKNTPIN